MINRGNRCCRSPGKLHRRMELESCLEGKIYFPRSGGMVDMVGRALLAMRKVHLKVRKQESKTWGNHAVPCGDQNRIQSSLRRKRKTNPERVQEYLR